VTVKLSKNKAAKVKKWWAVYERRNSPQAWYLISNYTASHTRRYYLPLETQPFLPAFLQNTIVAYTKLRAVVHRYFLSKNTRLRQRNMVKLGRRATQNLSR